MYFVSTVMHCGAAVMPMVRMTFIAFEMQLLRGKNHEVPLEGKQTEFVTFSCITNCC